MSYQHFVGIDCSAKTFCAALWHAAGHDATDRPIEQLNDVANGPEGYQQLFEWLNQHGCRADQTLICIENTGVYSEHLLYWITATGFALWLESPQKIARAFRLPQKSDPSDARQIAEYCYRYRDQLRLWQPPEEIIEQVQVLLSAREQLTAQLTATSNTLGTLKRKVVQTPTANQVLETLKAQLNEHIKQIERQIKQLIDSDSHLGSTLSLLTSIPGVGLLLAAHLIVLTRGATVIPEAGQLASYLGICPHEHSSGSSVYKRPHSTGFGSPMIRKLLYLSSMSIKRNDQSFAGYYARKKAEGKNGRLILNNISNKLIRIICGVLRSRTPYISNFRSVHPRFSSAAT